MHISSTLATWLSLAATISGLSSIATQFSTIIAQTDLFRLLRDFSHLGIWRNRQPHIPWYRIIKPAPVGSVIVATLANGICGRKMVHLSCLPLANSTGSSEDGSVCHTKEKEHIVTITNKDFDVVPFIPSES
ncbi:hypothetical protein N7528_009192 [Penicillium herquei]|nr:hypothetical protein N7528_009192 [Penicillium herquei]